MVNQPLIDDWQRRQGVYSQTRAFTPGKQETQYRLTTGGRPKTMPLLLVVHNDAPPGPNGGQYVDVLVKSGGTNTPAERANGHLTNVYDAEAGITSHLALYNREDMEKIARASAYPHQLRDWPDGGPPGGVIYSVNAQMVDGPDGIPRVNTDGPMTAGDRPDRYSLHDVQAGMNSAEQLGRIGSEQYAPVPVPAQAAPAATSPEPHKLNSQAGLAAHAGPKNSYPSVPAPGQPGSRFNPIVRERSAQSQPVAAKRLPTVTKAPRGLGGMLTSPQATRGARQVGAGVSKQAAESKSSLVSSAAKGAVGGMIQGLATGLSQQRQAAEVARAVVDEAPQLESPAVESPVASPTKPPLSQTYDYKFVEPPAAQAPAQQESADTDRALSQSYDYQFLRPPGAGESQSQYGS